MGVTRQCPENGEHTGRTAGTCVLTCNTGFSASNNVPYTCAPDQQSTTASYQGGSVDCTATKCRGGGAASPDNGEVSKSAGNKHGSVASFQCNDGFELIGSASITCDAASADA